MNIYILRFRTPFIQWTILFQILYRALNDYFNSQCLALPKYHNPIQSNQILYHHSFTLNPYKWLYYIRIYKISLKPYFLTPYIPCIQFCFAFCFPATHESYITMAWLWHTQCHLMIPNLADAVVLIIKSPLSVRNDIYSNLWTNLLNNSFSLPEGLL